MSEYRIEKSLYLRFVRDLILWVVGGHLLLGSLNWIVADYVKPGIHQILRLRRDVFRNRVQEARSNQFLVLGDSTTLRMVHPSRIAGARGFSLATWASYSPEAYFVYQDYVENVGAPRCLVYSSTYGGYEHHLNEYSWDMLIPAGNYSLDQLIELYETSAKLNSAPGSLSSVYWMVPRAIWEQIDFYLDWNAAHRYLIYPHKGRISPRLTYALFRFERGAGPLNNEDILEPIPFNGPMQAYLNEKFKPSPIVDLYLHRLIEAAERTNTRVLFYWAPLAQSLRNPVSDAWVKDATQYISKLISAHPNAEDHLKISWEPDIFFTDGNHVNRKRGQEYSQELAPDLLRCLNR